MRLPKSISLQFKKPPTAAHHQMVRDRGGLHRMGLDGAGDLKTLAGDPDVAYIASDRPVSAAIDTTAATVNAHIAFKCSMVWGSSVLVSETNMV